MLFNSVEFVALVAATFAAYYAPVLSRYQILTLLVASLTFYAWDQPWLVLLLILSAAITSASSFAVFNSKQPLLWATLGVLANLSVLIFFKYGHLLSALFGFQAGSTGGVAATLLMLPLPIGISFYTFHGISLVVDAYKLGPERTGLGNGAVAHFRNTLLYIVFFPQLVAGPIAKAHNFIPQIFSGKRTSDIDWELVVHNLAVGYFLKMVVADNLAQQTFFIKLPYFENLSSIELLCLLVGYSAQIFADFAGYSMIALGLAAVFGYKIPRNFDFPYISSTIAEFWRRWHISLSSFLREYLYIPLGGSRRGELRTYLNLIIVMFLGGLWHGTTWSYAVWGLWHGFGLALERPFLKSTLLQSSYWPVQLLRTIAVFAFVTLGWLLFKLTDFSEVLRYLAAIASNWNEPVNRTRLLSVSIYSAPVLLYHLIPFGFLARVTYRRAATGFLLAAILLNSGSSRAFIYFQF